MKLSKQERNIMRKKIEDSINNYLRNELINREEEPSTENLSFVLSYMNTLNLVKQSTVLSWLTGVLIILTALMILRTAC